MNYTFAAPAVLADSCSQPQAFFSYSPAIIFTTCSAWHIHQQQGNFKGYLYPQVKFQRVFTAFLKTAWDLTGVHYFAATEIFCDVHAGATLSTLGLR